jgi:hypothetical protein
MYVNSKGIIKGKYYGDFFEYLANIGVKQGDGHPLNCLLFSLIGYIPISKLITMRIILVQVNVAHIL